MALPSLTDAQIEADQPLDEALMKDGLRDRGAWNWDQATNGGTGIAPSVAAFRDGLTGHRHNGDPGAGQPIPADGIAAGAVFDADMIEDDAIGASEIASSTMGSSNLGSGAVLVGKMDSTMGTHFSGSQSFDCANAPRAGIDDVFEGDIAKITNTTGKRGVPTNLKVVDEQYGVRNVTTGFIYLGVDAAAFTSFSNGSWNYDFWLTG